MSTITDIKAKREEASLDSTLEEFKQWRANKTTTSTPIPDVLWRKIFHLAEQYSPSTIRGLFGITSRQYQTKEAQLCPKKDVALPPSADIALCEVKLRDNKDNALNKVSKEVPKLAPKPAYAPSDIPATTTIIVEFCRPDGQIMKIHTTNDSFEKLLRAFFKGGSDDTSHTQT